MGLFQSVFSISDDTSADLDPFQCQEGTYKKLDIDAIAAAAKARRENSPKNKLSLTAPRRLNYNKSDDCKTGNKTVGFKSRHSEKTSRERPKPISLGPDASFATTAADGISKFNDI